MSIAVWPACRLQCRQEQVSEVLSGDELIVDFHHVVRLVGFYQLGLAFQTLCSLPNSSILWTLIVVQSSWIPEQFLLKSTDPFSIDDEAVVCDGSQELQSAIVHNPLHLFFIPTIVNIAYKALKS